MVSILQTFSRSLSNLIEQNVNRLRPIILSNTSNGTNQFVNQPQIRGFKDKGILKLRCNKCYFKKLDDRWWVLCTEHPRHKQRQKVEDYRDKWIVTHLTRKGKPFQKREEAYICNTSPPGPYDYRKRIWNWEDVRDGKVAPILKKINYRF